MAEVLPIVDAHVHLCNPEQLRIPTANDAAASTASQSGVMQGAGIAPTLHEWIASPGPCRVGAGLAPALEHRPYLLKSAPMGAQPCGHP